MTWRDTPFLIIIVAMMFMMFFFIAMSLTIPRNAYHEYTGQVIAVKKDSYNYESTKIYLKTHSESALEISVTGFHDFEIGGTYRIETRGKWWWAMPKLLSAEKVEGE